MNTKKFAAAALALLFVKGVGPGKLGAIIRKHVPDENNALSLAESLLDQLSVSLEPGEVERLVSVALGLLEHYQNDGGHFVTLNQPDYPEQLKKLRSAPPVLFYRGNFALTKKSIAVIGTRQPTEDMLEQLPQLADALQHCSICNGLAKGVDRAVLMNQQLIRPGSIAVLGAGIGADLSTTMTRENARLAQLLLESGGLLLSEALPQAKEALYAVIKSCRIQAAISAGLILVQSACDGGSMFTVKTLVETGRPMAYMHPPQQADLYPAYGANIALTENGCAALAEMTGTKTSLAQRIELSPLNGPADAATFVQHALNGSSPAEQLQLF